MIAASHPDDATKPSRINRRRKKRWKNGLTNFYQADILSMLSQKTKVGIETPNNGHNRPLSTVVFLRPSKTQAALRRLNSVMEGCIGQPLKRLAGSVTGSLNPIQSAAQRLRPKGSGLSLYNGVTAMRNKYAQNPAKSSQYKYSLFNLVKRTPAGRRVICQDLTFTQAVALAAEIPATIVKFSRMEGAA